MTVPTQEAQTTSSEASKTAENNFANMRKQLDAERQEKAQMQKRLTELENASKKLTVRNDTDEDDSDEPYVDPKTLKKKFAKFEESMDQRIEKKAEEKARSMFEEERRLGYLKQNDDFQKIMSPDVIQKFAEKHPKIAEAILQMPDNFERQRLVYENIKALGVNKPEEPQQTVQQKIDANRKSPYYIPPTSGTAPYNGAGDFSPAGQKNAYEKLKELKGRLRI